MAGFPELGSRLSCQERHARQEQIQGSLSVLKSQEVVKLNEPPCRMTGWRAHQVGDAV